MTSPDVIEARKRCKLKRYLNACGCVVDTNMPTLWLRGIVKEIHRQRVRVKRYSYMWPLTPGQAEHRASEQHYINQLWAVKSMYGSHASIGCVTEAGYPNRCHTVADLIAIGWAHKRYAYLDQYLDTIQRIDYRDAA